MTVEERLLAKLLATTAVVDIVGDRIYPNELKQGVTPPAIVYMIVVEDPISSQSGTCLYDTVIYFACYGLTYSSARNLQKKVVDCLDRYDNQDEIIITRYKGIRGSEKEKDTEYHNIVLEFQILNK